MTDIPPPPKKLSTLIRLAVRDGLNLPQDKYKPDCGVFLDTDDETGICRVCDAGAVMVGTLDATPADKHLGSLFKERWGEEWANALHALDYARIGDYVNAVATLGVTERICLDGIVDVPEPEQMNYHGWYEQAVHLRSMESIADKLEAIGL